jgi:hypothetical protein
MGGLRQVKGFGLERMELAKPAHGSTLDQELGRPAGVQEGWVRRVGEESIIGGDPKGRKGLLQEAPGLVIVRSHGLAACAPELGAATPTNNPAQTLALAGAFGSWGKNGADLKGPETGATGLQVAAGRKQ